MEPDGRVLVPVGPEAWRWRTFGSTRTLVVAARTVTSLVRVLDVLPAVVHDDPRVATVFAYDPSSAFNDGVLALLRSLGCRTLPWAQLEDIKPDLLLTASENIGVPTGDYPVLVLPHGVGFQKFVPDSAGPGTRLSGLVADELLTTRRAWLTLSHPEQEKQLAAARPNTVGRTVLVGDPCLDRLLASVRWRDRYRAALGVPDGLRLVLVSSTWGAGSLIANRPDLPTELLSQLPADEFRVALVLHPNVWAAHGAWQIRSMQQAATEAGLLVVDPTNGWQQALVAADLVIGDHGSVTLYGAAVDRPLLLGAFGAESVPQTAGYGLRAAARWLDAGPLRAQVDAAVTEHRPGRFAEITARAFADPGKAQPRIRRLVYDLLGLPVPDGPVRGTHAYPAPPTTGAPVTAMSVRTVVERATDRVEVEIRRYPARLAVEGAEQEHLFWHLACDVDEPDPRLSESASVLLRAGAAVPEETGLARIAGLLADFPGAQLAALAVADGCLLGLRDGSVLLATARCDPPPDPGLAAAGVYACLRLGRRAVSSVHLRVGDREQELWLRQVLPPSEPSARRARSTSARGLPPAS
ncbi:CDP-glycerol glycerophosphotransferase family protein [Kitasatospora sp. NPDC101801]|uniref:CDP-glycerol glycerophosphotransferase family protein n=1 Tax=Kitasatospora sp. NPDC101801 TaxID=3364103 RepID=UPI00382D4138